MTLAEAAERVGVAPRTLRRWQRLGLIPQYQGDWSGPAISAARLVARLRDRGHALADLRRATEEGRLAIGLLEETFPPDPRRLSVAQAARATGLAPALVRRLIGGLGISPDTSETVSEHELESLRYVAAALQRGFPLVAVLQLTRVYGQAMAAVADAEVRLFHLHVHEPLMRSGATGVEAATQMSELSRQVLPLAEPILDRIHRSYLAHFLEQDVVAHMEADLDGTDAALGQVRVAIAFADLAGYTQLIEAEGELSALDAVARFVDSVAGTLPDGARVLKTIGDEAMIIGADPQALTLWAVAFQASQTARPLPRIAVHYGVALYRDGDYFGRDVNIASRVAARSAGGEVLATRPVVEAARGDALRFERIGEVRLKGLRDPTEMFVARASGAGG